MAAAIADPKVVIRDQVGDHLVTPKNSALLVIDYQPSQVAAVRSMDRDLLLKNVVSTAKLAKLFGLTGPATPSDQSEPAEAGAGSAS